MSHLTASSRAGFPMGPPPSHLHVKQHMHIVDKQEEEEEEFEEIIDDEEDKLEEEEKSKAEEEQDMPGKECKSFLKKSFKNYF